MIKRVLCVILMICFLASSTACSSSKTSSGEVVRPDAKGVPELNIILMPGMENWEKQEYFADYKKDFEQKYGVKVNYIRIASFEDGSKQLMTKLSVENGPELVLDAYETVRLMIDSDAAVDMKNKVDNVKKIYSSLVGDEIYYVPVGIAADAIALKKDVLEEWQIPAPNLDWTQEDYFKIRDKWLSQSQRAFTRYEFHEILNRYLLLQPLFDFKSEKAKINTDEVKDALSNIRREIYNGSFKLNKEYTYKNYYNLIFEMNSPEYREDLDLRLSTNYSSQDFRSRSSEASINILYPQDIDLQSTSKLVVRPYFGKENIEIWSMGFVVNKNGANLGLAYEFINGLLSDDVQMSMHEQERPRLYPVNSDIDSRINDMEKQKRYSEEALQLKQYVLQKIKDGHYELIALEDSKKNEMNGMLIKDLLPLIFADKEYSDAELSKELQKIEDKFNIYLSE